MPETIKLHIGGRWREGGRGDTLAIHNPANGAVLGVLALADESDLDDALAAVAQGFAIWRKLPVGVRGQYLRRVAGLLRDRAALIARTLTQEEGKPLAQATGEVMGTAAYFDDLANTAQMIFGRYVPPAGDGLTRKIVHVPIGPTFGVAPWNLPALMPGRKIANALAAGCSIILKPAKETPMTAAQVVQCCIDAEIPPGVVNMVSGAAGLVSAKMLQSPVIRKISFTGSTDVGKDLAAMAGAHMKKATMELGGHAPVIVCDDVDVESITDTLVAARYANAGQSCMAPTRFFVQEAIYKEFAHTFARKAAALQLGDGLDPQTQMGPLAHARRPPFMQELTDDALARHASLLTGGRLPSGQGCFYPPTVLMDVPGDARIMNEEPFGPVTPIVPFSTLEEVSVRANATPYGLAAYVFTRALKNAHQLTAELDAGLVGLNSTQVAAPSVPFGGVRDSGIGREGSIEGLLESMTTKAITIAS